MKIHLFFKKIALIQEIQCYFVFKSSISRYLLLFNAIS